MNKFCKVSKKIIEIIVFWGIPIFLSLLLLIFFYIKVYNQFSLKSLVSAAIKGNYSEICLLSFAILTILIILILFILKILRDMKKKGRSFIAELAEKIMSQKSIIILLIIVVLGFFTHLSEWFIWGPRESETEIKNEIQITYSVEDTLSPSKININNGGSSNNPESQHSIGDTFTITFISLLISAITVVSLFSTVKQIRDNEVKINGYEDFYKECIKLFKNAKPGSKFYYSGDTLIPGAYFKDNEYQTTLRPKDLYIEDMEGNKQPPRYSNEFQLFLDRADKNDINVKIILPINAVDNFIIAGAYAKYVKRYDYESKEKLIANWTLHSKFIKEITNCDNKFSRDRIEIGFVDYSEEITDYFFVSNEKEFVIAYPQSIVYRSILNEETKYRNSNENPDNISIVGISSNDYSLTKSFIKRYMIYWDSIRKDGLIIDNENTLSDLISNHKDDLKKNIVSDLNNQIDDLIFFKNSQTLIDQITQCEQILSQANEEKDGFRKQLIEIIKAYKDDLEDIILINNQESVEYDKNISDIKEKINSFGDDNVFKKYISDRVELNKIFKEKYFGFDDRKLDENTRKGLNEQKNIFLRRLSRRKFRIDSENNKIAKDERKKALDLIETKKKNNQWYI